jgi:hypothetical protein
MRLTRSTAAWLVPLLLRLYPARWRERYGNEFADLLDDCQPSLWDLCDVLRGAVDAQLHIDLLLERIPPMRDQLRRAEITVFCAWIAFVIAGLAFQKVSEYDDFLNAAHASPLIGASYLALEVGAVVALLAVLAGGLPLALSALRHALAARRGDVLLLLGVPVLAFMGLVMYGYVGLQVVGSAATPSSASAGPTPQGKALFLGLIGVLILGAAASSWAVSTAISRSAVDPHWYRFARLPALVTVLSLAVMCVATVTWGLALRAERPQLFTGDDGIVATSTALSWLIIAAVMLLATLVALAALFRGLLPTERVETPQGHAATPAQL